MDLLPANSWTTNRKNGDLWCASCSFNKMIPEGKVVHTDNARGDNYGAKHMEVIQGAILNQHFNIKKHYCMIMAMTLPAC